MSNSNLAVPAGRLPPTTASLFDDDARPCFLWWTDATVGQFKEHLRSSDPEERAYWMGQIHGAIRRAEQLEEHEVGPVCGASRDVGGVFLTLSDSRPHQ